MTQFSALELVGSTVGRVRRTLGLNTVDGDPALDRLARLAARLLGVPVALVSLVDVDEQVFPGQSGLPDTRSTPLSHSFCKTVVATREVVTTVDAREDIVRLLDWGADSIISDRPDVAVVTVREWIARRP